MYADLIVEKKYVGDAAAQWCEVADVANELERLESYYKDPGLLMFGGSQFRTPWAMYRVSTRRLREEAAAA